jgi:hypothetical protein
MTTLTVKELIKLVTKDEFFGEFLLEYLDFVGGNEHLQNSEESSRQKREVALSGDEIVSGDYLLFSGCGHDTSYVVYTCDSLQEIEQELIGPAGITNSFTSEMVAIVNGKVMEYTVRGKVNFDDEITFVKYENDNLFYDLHEKWVEWKDSNKKYLNELEREIQYNNPLRVLDDRFDSMIYKKEFLKNFHELDDADKKYFLNSLERQVSEINKLHDEFIKSIKEFGDDIEHKE